MLCWIDMSLSAIVVCFFFFSSRRRHTRSLRDWSSDVCSSDLQADAGDRANDSLRVDAPSLRAKVVGEGANLAITQRARIRSEERRVGKECRSRWSPYH